MTIVIIVVTLAHVKSGGWIDTQVEDIIEIRRMKKIASDASHTHGANITTQINSARDGGDRLPG